MRAGELVVVNIDHLNKIGAEKFTKMIIKKSFKNTWKLICPVFGFKDGR